MRTFRNALLILLPLCFVVVNAQTPVLKIDIKNSDDHFNGEVLDVINLTTHTPGDQVRFGTGAKIKFNTNCCNDTDNPELEFSSIVLSKAKRYGFTEDWRFDGSIRFNVRQTVPDENPKHRMIEIANINPSGVNIDNFEDKYNFTFNHSSSIKSGTIVPAYKMNRYTSAWADNKTGSSINFTIDENGNPIREYARIEMKKDNRGLDKWRYNGAISFYVSQSGDPQGPDNDSPTEVEKIVDINGGGIVLAPDKTLTAYFGANVWPYWPDYVFDEKHDLMTLKNLEKYIKQNKHLPEIPSSEDVKKDGVDLVEMNKLLLKKIEELTLYIIELNKKIDSK